LPAAAAVDCVIVMYTVVETVVAVAHRVVIYVYRVVMHCKTVAVHLVFLNVTIQIVILLRFLQEVLF
jgi:hypothetical protein